MKVVLNGQNEVPPNDSKATGIAEIDFDPATRKLNWRLTHNGLSGQPTAAHFHGPAGPGKNGRVAVVIPNATSIPIVGVTRLTEAQAADFLAGKYYINVHTATYPAGEIRGQVR